MRLAVLGSPIAHSLSPSIHSAAYGVLGLDWRYAAFEQRRETLPAFLDGLDASWRGLSVTAPLKGAAAAWVTTRDELVSLTGACNTVRVDARAGWNTDVAGIVRAFEAAGVAGASRAAILGGGATAVSALVALAHLGADRVAVRMRDVGKGARLETLAERLGVTLEIDTFEAPVTGAELAVSTLPAAADVVPTLDDAPAVILDADYASAASRYAAFGGLVVPGIEMLLHQALAQVRIFVHGDPGVVVEREPEVWSAMRAVVGA